MRFAAYNEFLYLFIVMLFFSLISTVFYNMIVLTQTQTKGNNPRSRIHVDPVLNIVTRFMPPDVNMTPAGPWENTCDKCFNINVAFLLDNSNICNTSTILGYEPEIDVLIFITSAHAHQAQRSVMRNTWLSVANSNRGSIRYAFLLGQSPDQSNNVELKEEHDIHNDIIQGDFIDSYKNLTYKTMMALTWAKSRCAHAWHVLKTDDDVYINIQGLLIALKGHSAALLNAIGGTCPNMAFPVRDNSSKLYVDSRTYPKKYYPTYCSGTAYIMSMRVALKVLEVSEDVPFFPIEDIYVAFCIQKLGFRFETIDGFHRHFVKHDKCNYKSHGVITSHGVSPDMMKNIWETKCPN